ncbi:amidase [Halorubrum vacuolatum]|uniref:Asp-tRNAAsn/Glu-tRNAGln amidotransferase A subunit n=1 Tax=Halorubrum vacuolatum TaxID=63740 RepID=A0A238Y5P2_HALVU|nr:amidase [Halorubrum vacuolatum]SNR66417.1 Asp-tRNAAsn/Glu-tRNAGln amidotransferase A subunit [Halorubrum vacuolatum]
MLHPEPLATTADALRAGQIDVSTYLGKLKARTDTVEPEVSALVPEEDRWNRLDEDAAVLAGTYRDPADRPSLYGVPIGIKDIIHVDGLPTQAGSTLPPDVLAGPEATVVRLLRDAGALVFGKTVTTEFAHFDPGPTRNPHDLDRTPGGSSSGSAAAVASGICPAALGTQTIGSVIRPAAFCGIVGFKPSFGRIPTDGVIPLSTSVDHVGFFTQDTAGASLLASILCDGWRQLPAPTGRPTLAVPDGPYLEQASPVALDAFESQLERLGKGGYELVRLSTLTDIEAINERHKRLVAADAALAHDEWYREYGDRYAEETGGLIETGKAVTIDTVSEARRSRHELRAGFLELMDQHDVDLWIAPAAPGPAPEGIETTGDPVMNLPWTHTGLPTITVPAGKTADDLPLGVQCAGRFGADEDVIRWSHGLADTLST